MTIAALLVAAVAVALYRHSERKRREAEDQRDEARAEHANTYTTLLLTHAANYRMACEIHGKAHVDRAIERANKDGRN